MYRIYLFCLYLYKFKVSSAAKVRSHCISRSCSNSRMSILKSCTEQNRRTIQTVFSKKTCLSFNITFIFCFNMIIRKIHLFEKILTVDLNTYVHFLNTYVHFLGFKL